MKLSPPQAMIKHERKIIEKHGEQTWFSKSGDRSVCPDKKWVDNLWARLRLVNKGICQVLTAILELYSGSRSTTTNMETSLLQSNKFKGTADHAELCANTDANHTCTTFSQLCFLAYIIHFDANKRTRFCF